MNPFDWIGQGQPKSPFLIDPPPDMRPPTPGDLMTPSPADLAKTPSDPGILVGPSSQPTQGTPFAAAPSPSPTKQRPGGPWAAEVHEIARQRGVDPTTLGAFMMIESGGRPTTKTGSYHGLMQLSPEQFRKYGGQGDIFDPRANLAAGAGKLADMSSRFQKQHGRAPSQAELYLMHQQGEGGAAAHLANPDRPAWQSMLSTGEGRQKGPEWARRAIWGNVPADVRAKYGSVDNITSGDFVKMWTDKVGRFAQRFGGAQPQITSQVGSPTASTQPVPAQPAARGQPGMLDKLLTAIGITPAAAETQQAPNADAMISSLERMGIKRDDPMYGAYAELAKAFAGGKKPAPEMGLGAKAIASLGDTLGTGFLARAGVKVPLIFPGMLDSQAKERQRLEERAYQAQLGLLGSALPYKQKDIERQRREDTMRSVMEDRPGLAPGGAQGVQLPAPAGAVAPPPVAAPGAPPVGQRLPPGPTAAPMPVDRGALPPTGGEGLAPESEALTTPQPAPQMPMPTPQVAAPMQPIAPAAPAPSAPAGPAGPGSKYRLTPEEVEARFPMPHPQRRIDALIAGGYDKEADNLRQANELMLKRREQFIKMYEVGRSTDDPESTKAKESAKLDAKREGDIKTAQVDAARAGKGIINNLRALKDMTKDEKSWSDYAVGRFDTSDEGIGPYGVNWFTPSGKQLGRVASSLDPRETSEIPLDETRSRIDSRMKAITSATKPFVRKPGEGTWTDKDQEFLEKMVGDLMQAGTGEELRRRVDQVYAMVNDTFAKPLGVELEPVEAEGGAKQPPATSLKPAASEPVGAVRMINGQPHTKTEQGWVPGGTAPQAETQAGRLNPNMGLNFVADRLRQPPGPAAPRRPPMSMLIDGESF